MQVQIATVKSRYLALTPDQRAVLAPVAPPPAALAPEAVPGPAPSCPEAAPPGDIAMLAAVPTPGGGGSGAGAAAVQAALTRIGSPYSWGGSGPGASDCSAW